MKKCTMTLAALLAATVALADKVITEKAPDGVNTQTTVVGDDGYVKSRSQTLAYAPEKYDGATYQPTNFCDYAEKVTAAVKDAGLEDAEVVALATGFFHETTNSSFITRKELTATQKRQLYIGRYVTLMRCYLEQQDTRIRALEATVEALEAERNKRAERLSAARHTASKAASTAKDKVKRAIERKQTSGALKKPTPRKAK